MNKNIAIKSILLLVLSVTLTNITAYCDPVKGALAVENNIASPDLETLRKRVVDDLLEPAVEADKIKKLVQTIRQDGSWPGINYKDTTKTGFEHRIHLENMLDLARAYKKPGSQFLGNEDVKKT